jgi:predicted nucleic acid-binding protein
MTLAGSGEVSVLSLDTTILIDILRGRPVVERLRLLRTRSDVVATSAINVEEVVRGLRQAEQGAAKNLFDGLLIVPIDRAISERAGAWRRDFAQQGMTLSQADSLIAAAAVSAGGRLATGNPRHFPMPELTVEEWPVGG